LPPQESGAGCREGGDFEEQELETQSYKRIGNHFAPNSSTSREIIDRSVSLVVHRSQVLENKRKKEEEEKKKLSDESAW
jgi:hypothetical protein